MTLPVLLMYQVLPVLDECSEESSVLSTKYCLTTELTRKLIYLQLAISGIRVVECLAVSLVVGIGRLVVGIGKFQVRGVQKQIYV